MTLFDTLKHYFFGTTPVAHADAAIDSNVASKINEDKNNNAGTKELKQGEELRSSQEKTVAAAKVAPKSEKKVSEIHKDTKKVHKSAGGHDGQKKENHTRDGQSAGKPKQHHHHPEYRECDGIRSVPLDKHLPDDDGSELEPMASIVPECYRLKILYDECFNRWFAQEFLNGNTNMKPCMELFKEYTSCVKKGLQDQNFELYPSLSLIPPDPDIQKAEKPRTKPPPGAEVHKDHSHSHDSRQHNNRRQ